MYIHRITTYLPTPEGWKAELARLALTHSEQFTHNVVACQLQIGCRAGKVRPPKTELRRQLMLLLNSFNTNRI